MVLKRGADETEAFEEEPYELKELASAAGHLRKPQDWNMEQPARKEQHAETFIPDPGEPAISEQAPIPPAAEPTVLLGREKAKEMKITVKPSAILKRSWRGQEDSIELKETSFKIGRAGEHASYADQASGVSRLHVEIEDVDGEYRAKDLGSRNGSLLNGQAMIPYKAYKLSMGDVIHLAGTEGPSYELIVSR
ncbi:FHA domain protein [compost metagenome]